MKRSSYNSLAPTLVLASALSARIRVYDSNTISVPDLRDAQKAHQRIGVRHYAKLLTGTREPGSGNNVNVSLPPPGSNTHAGGQVLTASMFEGAHDFNISGNTRITNIGAQNVKRIEYYGTDLINILEEFVSFDAFHDSSAQDPERRCHTGTREDTLKQMGRWIGHPGTKTERILWLHGPAGVGKSAITQTISDSYGSDSVAATFFFFRPDPDRNDGNRLFVTLAWKLAITIPESKDHIFRALSEDPDLPRKAIEIQFEHLIFRPFRALVEAKSWPQAQPSVIIIDGVDECTDEKLQRRLLNIIGNAVADNRFPLRFIISCRPEMHIQEALHPFQSTTLSIDLASVDKEYHDIEKYLKDKFALIATENQLDPSMWPDWSVVKSFVHRSSGQFVYAATIVKFIGNEYSSAIDQLEIITGLKPSNGDLPFANLDVLYIEILRRQPPQDFLKNFLTLLVVQSLVTRPWVSHPTENLGRDNAMLMNVDENGLRRKLRGMHSLLKFGTDHITVHHRSLIDFLQDPSRSRQYYIDSYAGTKRYLELITEKVVQCAYRIIEKPGHCGTEHFRPEFGDLSRQYPPRIQLPLDDWEEVLKPLFTIQDKILKIGNHEICRKCDISEIVDGFLLHLAILRAASRPEQHPCPLHGFGYSSRVVGADAEGSGDLTDVLDLKQKGIDHCLSSLLTNLQGSDSVPERIIMAVLQFDPAQVARKLNSAPDAQALMDFIFYLIVNRRLLSHYVLGAEKRAAILALEVYNRVPVLPQSFILNPKDLGIDYMGALSGELKLEYQGKTMLMKPLPFEADTLREICQDALTCAMLLHNNISPVIGMYWQGLASFLFVYPENGTLIEWTRMSHRSVAEVTSCMLDIAKAFQYLESLAISDNFPIDEEDFVVGSDSHVMLLPGVSKRAISLLTKLEEFGWMFFSMYFSLESSELKYRSLRELLESYSWNQPPNNVLKLIWRCCPDEPEGHKNMSDIVAEMESWRLEIHPHATPEEGRRFQMD